MTERVLHSAPGAHTAVGLDGCSKAATVSGPDGVSQPHYLNFSSWLEAPSIIQIFERRLHSQPHQSQGQRCCRNLHGSLSVQCPRAVKIPEQKVPLAPPVCICILGRGLAAPLRETSSSACPQGTTSQAGLLW